MSPCGCLCVGVCVHKSKYAIELLGEGTLGKQGEKEEAGGEFSKKIRVRFKHPQDWFSVGFQHKKENKRPTFCRVAVPAWQCLLELWAECFACSRAVGSGTCSLLRLVRKGRGGWLLMLGMPQWPFVPGKSSFTEHGVSHSPGSCWNGPSRLQVPRAS